MSFVGHMKQLELWHCEVIAVSHSDLLAARLLRDL